MDMSSTEADRIGRYLTLLAVECDMHRDGELTEAACRRLNDEMAALSKAVSAKGLRELRKRARQLVRGSRLTRMLTRIFSRSFSHASELATGQLL